jgi:hypothetical protein
MVKFDDLSKMFCRDLINQISTGFVFATDSQAFLPLQLRLVRKVGLRHTG